MRFEPHDLYDPCMTRVSSRAIVFIDQKVILLHRKRDGLEYWVTPGGKVEEGESLEDAVKREVCEEIGIDVKVGRKVFQVTNRAYNEDNEQHLFLCVYLSGRIGSGTDRKILDPDPLDFSEIVLADSNEVEAMNIVPVEAKEAIVNMMRKVL